MKKITNKRTLQLARENIRELTMVELVRVDGGSDPIIPIIQTKGVKQSQFKGSSNACK
jgi:hypothetical protein